MSKEQGADSKIEYKLRKQNVVFTVSEDYDRVPPITLFDQYHDYDMDYYKMLLLGFVEKTIDIDELISFLFEHTKKTALKNEFLKTVELFLDGCFSDFLIKERPGASEYRENFIEKREYFLSKKFNRNVENEIEYVYYNRIRGIYVDSRGVVEELIDVIRDNQKLMIKKMNEGNITTAEITREVISLLNKVFLKYFFVNTRNTRTPDSLAEILDEQEIKDKKPEKEAESRIKFSLYTKNLKNKRDDEKVELVNIESAEFTGSISEDIGINDERLSKEGQKVARSNEKVLEMVKARYGEPLYPPHVMISYEKDMCRDIHAGIKLHITDGRFGEGYDKYFENSIVRQREKNMSYYRDNELVFRRSIAQLREILRKKIMLEDEEEVIYSNSGSIDIKRIWKNRFLGEENIFKKVQKNEMGSLSVDILMDSSASQMEREEYVSSQAYIIAQALTSLNIPTRVVGFCNFFNFMVLTEYRSYEDPMMFNSRIFNYKGSGSNRDGLAIKLMADQMEKNEYENKILIVLSDGKPNDKINLGTTGFFEVEGQDYEDDIAVKDTAAEIFNLKLRGRYVLGVFTGEEDDLESEKRIYGRDFAYIKNMERFSQIIGFYIDKTLQ